MASDLYTYKHARLYQSFYLPLLLYVSLRVAQVNHCFLLTVPIKIKLPKKLTNRKSNEIPRNRNFHAQSELGYADAIFKLNCSAI